MTIASILIGSTFSPANDQAELNVLLAHVDDLADLIEAALKVLERRPLVQRPIGPMTILGCFADVAMPAKHSVWD